MKPSRAPAVARLARARARAQEVLAGLQQRTRQRRALPKPPMPKLPPPPTTTPRSERLAELRARRRRRRTLGFIAAIAAVLALLLLLRDCSCTPAPVPTTTPAALDCPPAPECVPAPRKPMVPARPRRPRVGAVKEEPRDGLALERKAMPSWIADFRLQVTARSLELAVCFNDAEKPGALRWSTTVNPRAGTAVDSAIEPVLHSAPLSTSQEACVLRTLATQPYRLVPDSPDDVGTRLSLVLEF
ncbi:MAG: hypothetical protein Q8O67_30420 [Deltaproteobacteria bacterium]|nr:hypothetical protein [Deltaproteobacteria bacterium]